MLVHVCQVHGKCLGVHLLFLEAVHQTGTRDCLWKAGPGPGESGLGEKPLYCIPFLFSSIPSACHYLFQKRIAQGCLAGSDRRTAILELRVVSWSPMVDVEMT